MKVNRIQMEQYPQNNSEDTPECGHEQVEDSLLDLEKEAASAKEVIEGFDENSLGEEILVEKARDLKKIYRNFLDGVAAAAGLATIFLASSLREAPPPDESWQEKHDRAALQMREEGITWEQRNTYVLGVNDLIYRAVGPLDKTPSSAADWKSLSSYVWNNLVKGRENAYSSELKAKTDAYKKQLQQMALEMSLTPLDESIDFKKIPDLSGNPGIYEQQEDNPGEEDSWRLYLGIPQKFKTYKVSDFKPSVSKEDKLYYDFNDREKEFYGLDKEKVIEYILKKFGGRTGSISSMEVNQSIVGSKTMYHFQWSKGEDQKGIYVAYYDIWDLNVPVEKNGFFGAPFEIYGRIYYNPETFEIINSK